MSTKTARTEPMDGETANRVANSIFEDSRATRDALTVKKVFGDAYQVDGRTVIPVAVVSGGGGGGGGEGSSEGHADSDVEADADQQSGSGFGTGFGINARPAGVYVADDSGVEWKPAVDVVRLVRGGQILAGIVVICAAFLLRDRWT